jgi:hypothetical protein
MARTPVLAAGALCCGGKIPPALQSCACASAMELMHDVKAVDWLPLDDAVERLSRGYERAFLENVGPLAVQAAAHARATRRSKARQPAPVKRRSRPVTAPQSLPVALETPPPQAEPVPQDLLPVETVVPVAIASEATCLKCHRCFRPNLASRRRKSLQRPHCHRMRQLGMSAQM